MATGLISKALKQGMKAWIVVSDRTRELVSAATKGAQGLVSEARHEWATSSQPSERGGTAMAPKGQVERRQAAGPQAANGHRAADRTVTRTRRPDPDERRGEHVEVADGSERHPPRLAEPRRRRVPSRRRRPPAADPRRRNRARARRSRARPGPRRPPRTRLPPLPTRPNHLQLTGRQARGHQSLRQFSRHSRPVKRTG